MAGVFSQRVQMDKTGQRMRRVLPWMAAPVIEALATALMLYTRSRLSIPTLSLTRRAVLFAQD